MTQAGYSPDLLARREAGVELGYDYVSGLSLTAERQKLRTALSRLPVRRACRS
jgi:hypothetical protein